MKKPLTLLFWSFVIVIIIAIGIIGFMITDNYSFLDALYMTVITIATIGYHEIKPLTTAGKIFNILYIVFAFAVFTYALSRLTKFIVSGEMAMYFKNRKLMKAIDEMNNHVIICGFGRNGQQAAHILMQNKTDFVVIDNDPQHFKEWLEDHNSIVYVQGDALEDDTLMKAGILKASAILLTLPVDADNVFVVLSARSLNQNLQIISRAGQRTSIRKLKTAGADHVILPDVIGGSHMATLLSKPDVVEFINSLWIGQGEAIEVESIDHQKLPKALQDKCIWDVMNTEQTGVHCIGIRDNTGKFIINPSVKTTVQSGMKLMMLGTPQQMKSFQQYLHEMNGSLASQS